MIFGDFFGKWGGDWNKNMEMGRGMGVGKKKCMNYANSILMIFLSRFPSKKVEEYLQKND